MAAPDDHVPEAQLFDSFVRHATRAQFFRYLDYASRPNEAQEILRDLVSDKASAAALTLQHAASVGGLADSTIEIRPEGVVEATTECARATFARDGFLPQLRAVTWRDRPAGRPIGAEARIRSTVHYFIALVENPARDPEPFRELLADPFCLRYTAEPIVDFESVRTWVTGRLASVVASEHDIGSISLEDCGGGTHVAHVRMKSQALFPDGSGAISRNAQCWTLADDPTRLRFPQIREISIERDAVEFFGPGPDYAPRALPG